MSDDNSTFDRRGFAFATGVARFRDHPKLPEPRRGKPEPRIYLEVLPETVATSVLALVDTAAPWCIFTPAIGEEIREHLEVMDEGVVLHTRLGPFQGDLYRGMVTLIADEGEPLEVNGLIFLSPDWPGGNFLGYQGFLQKIRFAVDPYRNRFFFASDF